METLEQIAEDRKAVQSWMKDYAREHPLEGKSGEAVKYIIDGKGSFWRPLVVINTVRSYKERIGAQQNNGKFNKLLHNSAVPAGAAVEIHHRITLTLDDLPCMDDSNLRHGRESPHIKFGEASAVLASYAFHGYGNAIITDEMDVPDEQRLEIIRKISSTIRMLTKGQEKDLNMEGIKKKIIEGGAQDIKAKLKDSGITPHSVYHSYELKTGALYACSSVVGGIIAKAPRRDLAHLDRFGIRLGIGYQTLDDLYDRFGDAEQGGKPTGQDRYKATLLDFYSAEAVLERVGRSRSRALQSLNEISTRGADFSLLQDIVGVMIPDESLEKIRSNIESSK